MPEVSRFFGISIRMYYDEHNPPHFHAIYAESEAQIGITPISLLEGQLPRRALGLVVEWAAERQPQLRENWTLMRNDQPPNWIDPLE